MMLYNFDVTYIVLLGCLKRQLILFAKRIWRNLWSTFVAISVQTKKWKGGGGWKQESRQDTGVFQGSTRFPFKRNRRIHDLQALNLSRHFLEYMPKIFSMSCKDFHRDENRTPPCLPPWIIINHLVCVWLTTIELEILLKQSLISDHNLLVTPRLYDL